MVINNKSDFLKRNKMTKEEESILSYFIDSMESRGESYNTVVISFDEVVIKEIEKKYSVSFSDESKKTIFNKLISHEYIAYMFFGGEEYSGMKITLKGLGAINSIRLKREQLEKRSILKKLSDGIENHKGLATFIGTMLAILTIIFKYMECR